MYDNKEIQMFDYYYEKLSLNTFDEKDIYGLFILLRNHAKRDSWVREIGDLIAHRKKERGNLFDSIIAAREVSLYHSGKVPGSKGIQTNDFVSMFNSLLGQLGYRILDNEKVVDVLLCVFSIAQHTKYYDEKNISIGRLFIHISEASIELLTDTDRPQHIILGTIDNKYMTTSAKMPLFCLDKPITVMRDNGRLVIEYDSMIL